MPWKELSVSEQRLAMVHRVITLKHSVVAAAAEFGVSRKTLYKWLNRYRAREPFALEDRSRRPHRSPAQTPDAVERAVVDARGRLGWGARKIHATLVRQQVADLPSARTVGSILARHGCLGADAPQPAPVPPRGRSSGRGPTSCGSWTTRARSRSRARGSAR